MLVHDSPAEIELMAALLRLRLGLEPICCSSVSEAARRLGEFGTALERAGQRGVLVVFIDEDMLLRRGSGTAELLRERARRLGRGILRLRIYASVSDTRGDI